MNHDNAIKTMAAERYILDELDPAERDAFEEHFFDCSVCTADVRDAAKIAGGVRTGTRIVPAKHYAGWAAAAAAAAVVVGLSSQYAPQIASLWHRTPAPITQVARVTAPEQVIQLERTRAAKRTYVIRGDQSAEIDFTISQPDVPAASYTCELQDADGIVVKARKVSQHEADETVGISVPPHALHSGDYNVVIRGGDREIPGYHFTVGVQ